MHSVSKYLQPRNGFSATGQQMPARHCATLTACAKFAAEPRFVLVAWAGLSGSWPAQEEVRAQRMSVCVGLLDKVHQPNSGASSSHHCSHPCVDHAQPGKWRSLSNSSFGLFPTAVCEALAGNPLRLHPGCSLLSHLAVLGRTSYKPLRMTTKKVPESCAPEVKVSEPSIRKAGVELSDLAYELALHDEAAACLKIIDRRGRPCIGSNNPQESSSFTI